MLYLSCIYAQNLRVKLSVPCSTHLNAHPSVEDSLVQLSVVAVKGISRNPYLNAILYWVSVCDLTGHQPSWSPLIIITSLIGFLFFLHNIYAPRRLPLKLLQLRNKSRTLNVLVCSFKLAKIAYSFCYLFVRNRTKYNQKSCQEPHWAGKLLESLTEHLLTGMIKLILHVYSKKWQRSVWNHHVLNLLPKPDKF